MERWMFFSSAMGAVHPDLEHQGHPSPSGVLLSSLERASFHPHGCTSTSDWDKDSIFHRGKGMGAITPIKCWHHHSRHSLEHKGITTKSALYRTGSRFLLLLWAVPKHKELFSIAGSAAEEFPSAFPVFLRCVWFSSPQMGICGTKRNSRYSLENGQKRTGVGLPFPGDFVSPLLELLII